MKPYASLCFYGDNLDCKTISSLLGQEASDGSNKGEVIISPSNKRRVAQTGTWIYHSDSAVNSENIIDHVNFLCSILGRKVSNINELPDVSIARLRCCLIVDDLFSIELPSHLLDKLASMGLNLGLDIYPIEN